MTEHNDTVVADTETAAVEETTEAAGGQAAAAPADVATEPTTTEPAGAKSPVGADEGDADQGDADDQPGAPGGDGESGESGETGAAPGRRRPAKVADLEREGEVAADFLETLLDIADLDGDIDVDVDGDRAAVSIVDSDEGRVPRRLVGQDGKVLEALQELTRLAVQSATGERSRLMLDVAGHRAERRSSLVELAHTAIEQVKASGEKAALDPMTAFERKVVHDEVLAAGLSSESDGVEPKRYVVILPA
ncbi:spoIIIJ-associated protein [Pedococcus dokdonensis]|uniref:SpoIIIJ-associated protein n=1 Tax=Pedococcus dokdonensis TaxID=443156 RepID=A0A1H0TIJ1_9MICO|nr:R3H domain-containing nucleic acid-binding protein [Pedococcus dokdonensis]SDP53784.1 spoIIIJ-associated protein [Pedococcus dokdonensis]